MGLFWLAVFLFAAWHTVKHGTPAAGRAIKRGYQNRMDKWRAANPDASKPALIGAGIASGLATFRYGPGYARREFVQSWRDSWAAAKQRYLGLPVEEPEPEVQPDPQPDKVPPAPAVPPPAPQRPVAVPPEGTNVVPLRRAPQPAPQPKTDADKEGTTDMAIETATSGEVTSPETLHAELDSVVKEASADMDDASADEQRAKEDLVRIENITGSVTRLKLPTADIGMVQRLKEPAQRRLAAAESRKAAASERLAQAQEALEMAAKHVQIQTQGAAGEFYGNN